MKSPQIPGVHPFDLLFHFIGKLASLLVWTIIAIAHLAAAVTALSFLWWHQVQPSEIAAALREMSDSSALAVASALGASLLTLCWAYWRLARRAHRAAASRAVYRYLTKGLLPE